jgi:methionyl aminopeptidase
MAISLKSKKEIASMRHGGKILAEIMQQLEKEIVPGQNTEVLDKLAERLVFASGGHPAFKGYGTDTDNPFPGTICASLNAEIVHGIPSAKRIIQSGDILKIDIGMQYEGMFLDMARTFPVGKISIPAQKIIAVVEECFWEGIKNLKEGAMLSDYSKAVQKYVESAGFSVVRNLVGHGIGQKLHEDPNVPNYYEKKYQDFRLFSGMMLALEPMINEGTHDSILGKDGWVFTTKDGKLSAHYENTILITENGTEVLTV